MRLIPHHQDDRRRREYRSPDGTWRVVRTRRPGGNRNERPRWEVHERPEAHAPWHCHAAFERRRDALVFLDTTVVTPGGESTAASAAPPRTTTLHRHECQVGYGDAAPRKGARPPGTGSQSAGQGLAGAGHRVSSGLTSLRAFPAESDTIYDRQRRSSRAVARRSTAGAGTVPCDRCRGIRSRSMS